jgi:hypothetical protein
MLVLIVLICAVGMNVPECRDGRDLGHSKSAPLAKDECVARFQSLQSTKAPDNTYLVFWCQPADITA